MTGAEGKPPNSEAMSDILASIRRIVADESSGARRLSDANDAVFELTPAMRIDGGDATAVARPSPPSPPTSPVSAAIPTKPAAPAPQTAVDRPSPQPRPTPAAPSAAPAAQSDPADAIDADASQHDLDEAAVADIVRTVLRQEFAGDFGRSLTQQLTTLVRREIARHEEARRKDGPGV